jgi:hypothetical protein
MKTYSDFIDAILRTEGLLQKLVPTEPQYYDLLLKVRAADDATLTDQRPIGKPPMLTLVRGGLLYALDAIDEAHKIFQDSPGDLGSYWHGMVHRREGDFDNARYWFRRTGELTFFGELHSAASAYSADMGRQSNWDPYLFTGACEQARFGETEGLKDLATLQRLEFEAIFAYCWRQSEVG